MEGYLVPALGLPAERILLSNDLALGQPTLVELERLQETLISSGIDCGAGS